MLLEALSQREMDERPLFGGKVIPADQSFKSCQVGIAMMEGLEVRSAGSELPRSPA